MEKVMSIEQFNYAVEMITANPSEKAILAYLSDPFVYRMVRCIKDAISSAEEGVVGSMEELFELFERQAIKANYPISFSKTDRNTKYFYSQTQAMFDGWLLHYRSSNGTANKGEQHEKGYMGSTESNAHSHRG